MMSGKSRLSKGTYRDRGKGPRQELLLVARQFRAGVSASASASTCRWASAALAAAAEASASARNLAASASASCART
jgi:hypothetical protein